MFRGFLIKSILQAVPNLMHRKKIQNLQIGFTLIEILVVIAIIALLGSILLVAMRSAVSKARYAVMARQLDQINKAAQLGYLNNGVWANDVFPGADPSFVGGASTSTLGSWPTPPCKNWTYDWDNWEAGQTGPGSGSGWGTVYPPAGIRVTIRDTIEQYSGSPANRSVMYICVDDALKDNCQWGDLATWPGGGGLDFKNLKSITCNE